MRFLTFAISILMFISCTKNISAIAHIKGVGSNQINGAATFIEENGFVKLMVELRGVDKEKIAIHIHELGDCESLDGSSAGGHWNPTQEQHGKWGELPFHSGDIGNIDANSSGFGKLTLKTNLWCLSCNDSLKNIVGKSIIIHQGEDDFSSQPSGNAGPRIGCGVIRLIDSSN